MTQHTEINIIDLAAQDIALAAALFAATFLDDDGILALFPAGVSVDKALLQSWFTATINMYQASNQMVRGAYLDDQLVGVTIVSRPAYRPTIRHALAWTWRVASECNFKTAIATVKHDHGRRPYLSHPDPWIVEFVAVDPSRQKQGIGGRLFQDVFSAANVHSQNVWLETTRERNLRIFGNKGFTLLSERNESAVTYYSMLRAIS